MNPVNLQLHFEIHVAFLCNRGTTGLKKQATQGSFPWNSNSEAECVVWASITKGECPELPQKLSKIRKSFSWHIHITMRMPVPKLIGLSVMDECESVSTAMSVLLSRFKNLPQATYYDNNCNLEKSDYSDFH